MHTDPRVFTQTTKNEENMGLGLLQDPNPGSACACAPQNALQTAFLPPDGSHNKNDCSPKRLPTEPQVFTQKK